MSIKHWIILLTCMIFTMVGVQSTNAQDSSRNTQIDQASSSILDLAFTYDYRSKTIARFLLDYPPSYSALEAIEPQDSFLLRDFDFLPSDDSTLYGVSKLFSSEENYLYAIDLATFKSRNLGRLDPPRPSYNWTGFAGDPITGNLFGLAMKSDPSFCDGASAIYQIDVHNITMIELAWFDEICLNYLAIDNNGEVYSFDFFNDYNTVAINRGDWDYSIVGSGDWGEDIGPLGTSFDGNGNLYYLMGQHLGYGYSSTAIVEIDVDTGQRIDGTWQEIHRGNNIPGKSGLSVRKDFEWTPTPTYHSISGKVIEDDLTTPILGVEISLYDLIDDSFTSVQTKNDGTYLFQEVEFGDYHIIPDKSGYSFAPSGIALSFSNEDNDAEFVNFIGYDGEVPTYSISGKVTEEDQSTPIVGTTVILSDNAGPIETTTVAAGGSYSFDDVSPGEYVTTPEKDGYVFTPGFEIVEVVGSDVEFVNFVGSELSISGYVYDVNGEPLEGANIQLRDGETLNQSTELDSRTTDISGYYEFSDLLYGQEYVIVAPFPEDKSTWDRYTFTVPSLKRKETRDFHLLEDNDGDHIADDWEIHGYDFDSDGIVDIPLHEMGADPERKDLFVEVDYMEGHQLSLIALELIVTSFWASPGVDNLNNEGGIHIHIDNGPDSCMDTHKVNGTAILDCTPWGHLSRSNQLKHRDFVARSKDELWDNFDLFFKKNNFEKERERVFRYGVFTHNVYYTSVFCSPAGEARSIPGHDFVIGLGGIPNVDKTLCIHDFESNGTILQQASTFMHELGHTLNLRHGGFQDTPKGKPNYISVMNHFYVEGIHFMGDNNKITKTVDYSRFATTPLDEKNLDETAGVQIADPELGIDATSFYIAHNCRDWLIPSPPKIELESNLNGVDWNCDGDSTDSNLARSIDAESPQIVLNGQNDWERLEFLSSELVYYNVSISGSRSFGYSSEVSNEPTLLDFANIEVPSRPNFYSEKGRYIRITPNQQLVLPLVLSNTGTTMDTYEISVLTAPSWVGTSNIPSMVILEANEEVSLDLPITTPNDLSLGVVTIEVIANSTSIEGTFDVADITLVYKIDRTYLPVIRR